MLLAIHAICLSFYVAIEFKFSASDQAEGLFTGLPTCEGQLDRRKVSEQAKDSLSYYTRQTMSNATMPGE
jgi:hypothetical protein